MAADLTHAAQRLADDMERLAIGEVEQFGHALACALVDPVQRAAFANGFQAALAEHPDLPALTP